MVEIYFLGVGGSVPARDRGLPAIAIRRPTETILFDCGEGSQTSFFQAKLGVNRPLKVLITHLHGDHVFGLPSLLYTLSLMGRERPVEIVGPRGLYLFIKTSLETGGGGLGYDLRIYEVEPGNSLKVLFETKDYVISAGPAAHTVPAFFYIYKEKPRPGKFNAEKALELGIPPGPLRKKLQEGRPVALPNGKVVYPSDVMEPPIDGVKIAYSGDTAFTPRLIRAAQSSDILIHDSTFTEKHRHQSEQKGHSTAMQAGLAARESKSAVLFLFHFSQRYRELSVLLDEARKVHRLSFLSKRGMKVLVKKDRNSLLLLFSDFLTGRWKKPSIYDKSVCYA